MKKKKSDVFGFGEVTHQTYPTDWKEIKKDWNNRFPELEVNVKVDSYVWLEGIRMNPFRDNLTI
ncbi:hypothetical protein BIV60_10000 [Bacillus sp. MUM 116]|nr:hypothetical protein BIV60_10000 [Bacillus sp. MUM 116]